MSRIIKPLSSEASVTTADTVSNAQLVRIHASGGASIVTVRDAESNILGTFTVPSTAVEYVAKEPTHTIACSVACLCTSVAFQ